MPEASQNQTQSRDAFLKAPDIVRDLVKAILHEERLVMHLKTRPDIHKNILQHVKRLVQ